MKKTLLPLALLFSLAASSQSVFGYWYGTGNVNASGSASNYLLELVLQPGKGTVKGILNYYFKNTYRSLQVKGNYNPGTRELNLYNIPVTYYGSAVNMEVDCIMNMRAILMVASAGSTLKGQFLSLPDTRYTCADISFNLGLNAEASKIDSVIKAIREFKETNQVWTPGATDTATAVTVIQRKVINYVVENQYREREDVIAREIEVESDSIRADFYDNGEVDGDSISVFFNKQLIAFYQKLTASSVHFDLVLDSSRQVNELTMFANNLGEIPPNTALMVVDDGKNKFHIRLSSSLDKNATIRIRRKKK